MALVEVTPPANRFRGEGATVSEATLTMFVEAAPPANLFQGKGRNGIEWRGNHLTKERGDRTVCCM